MTQHGRNLILNGPPGTGKDHLLAAMMAAAVRAGRVVLWTSGPELFARWRDGIDGTAQERETLFRHVRPDVLAISDPVPPFGGLTPWQAAKLYELVDARYSRRRAVWVTCNLADAAQASHQIGEAILDRLRHDAVSLSCQWPSYRKPMEAAR